MKPNPMSMPPSNALERSEGEKGRYCVDIACCVLLFDCVPPAQAATRVPHGQEHHMCRSSAGSGLSFGLRIRVPTSLPNLMPSIPH